MTDHPSPGDRQSCKAGGQTPGARALVKPRFCGSRRSNSSSAQSGPCFRRCSSSLVKPRFFRLISMKRGVVRAAISLAMALRSVISCQRSSSQKITLHLLDKSAAAGFPSRATNNCWPRSRVWVALREQEGQSVQTAELLFPSWRFYTCLFLVSMRTPYLPRMTPHRCENGKDPLGCKRQVTKTTLQS
jgi:hypothetical protein